MKRFIVIALVFMGLIQFSTQAQETNQEQDSIECLKNYSLYSLSFKKKMYDYAMPAWREMFKNCPDVTVSIYSDGVALYKHYMKKEKDASRKEAYLDSIMMVYDQRIKYFGSHPKYPKGWILGRKAMDLLKYRRNNVETLEESLGYFEECYDSQKLSVEPLVALNWFNTTAALVKQDRVSPDEALDVFIKVDEIVNIHIENEKNPEKQALLAQISKACGETLAGTGLNDCNQIELALTPRYEDIKDNQGAINRMLQLMNNLDCTNNELFAKASEQNYKLNPNASAAYFLARYFLKQEQTDRAIEYYNKAIDLVEVDDLRAKYYYELALLTFSYSKDGPKAREYAVKAIQNKSKWGMPYILIGNIYAMESKKYGSNDFEHRTVYWAAIDQYKKAKAVDPECGEEADKQIHVYSQYIPDKETGFFQGIEEGSKYTVGSWINVETTVRYR
ncbi:tetratricopeptide repeat protein [Carboxylicivirga caseinilyticus]|uniref:tetratricopeptide repeat protein n=1 Tax=Carboxylicivirga caseinilyticus TaxID=3417572 RepID=UPI003D35326C|nr:hypothetical protein [Marinilabiliaceae bacterium A049]